MQNPFTIEPPDTLDARRMHQLFVDALGDFPKLIGSYHTFINGHRGCGKSMMLRYLQPDCQCLAHGVPLPTHDFLAAYVPVKNSPLSLAEGRRLASEHADLAINEHLMCAHIAKHLFEQFNRPEVQFGDDHVGNLAAVRELGRGEFANLLRRAGASELLAHLRADDAFPPPAVGDALAHLGVSCHEILLQGVNYLKRHAFSPMGPYEGPLLGYFDFLLPLVRALRALPFMPKGPIYLLIDDADWLGRTQAKILNTWVAARTTGDVCLKIATQFRYPTYLTANGRRIETPHDFSEVNVSAVYTTDTRGYRARMERILAKRLALAGINASPREFFPPAERQEKAIAAIATKLQKEWEAGRGMGGYRAADDAHRYARPTFMKRLTGRSKGSSRYRYAGLDQLIHISSGIARNFLEPAARMFSNAASKGSGHPVECIPPKSQDEVIRDYSNEFLFKEQDRLRKDADLGDGSTLEDDGRLINRTELEKLVNLVQSLGAVFRAKLLSDDSERRIFSFALANAPNDELRAVLDLGLDLGFFHASTTGRKDGTGRTRLYILNRRFAPAFYLDPTGFAGYLHVTNEFLQEALNRPDALARRVKEAPELAEVREAQLSLI